MSFGTTLVAVKQAFKANLEARAGLSDVTITYGYPSLTPEVGDSIWFGNAESVDESPVMSSQAVDEDFRLDVRIQSLKVESEGQEAADLRCVELLVEVQEELAQNPTLGLASIQFAEMESWQHSSGPLEYSVRTTRVNRSIAGVGHGSAFDVKVRVMAILA